MEALPSCALLDKVYLFTAIGAVVEPVYKQLIDGEAGKVVDKPAPVPKVWLYKTWLNAEQGGVVGISKITNGVG